MKSSGGSEDWQRFVGSWATEATHPLLPGAEIRGHVSFQWLEGRCFLIERSHHGHPEVPDAIAIIGPMGGEPAMHYFDSRGVQRVYTVALDGRVWSFALDTPGFAQRFTNTFSADGERIDGEGELCRDGINWEQDLKITYRRTGGET